MERLLTVKGEETAHLHRGEQYIAQLLRGVALAVKRFTQLLRLLPELCVSSVNVRKLKAGFGGFFLYLFCPPQRRQAFRHMVQLVRRRRKAFLLLFELLALSLCLCDKVESEHGIEGGDELQLRVVVGLVLENVIERGDGKAGVQIVAERGDEGLRLVLREKPALVLLDLMLPGMDGNDICREIRKTSDCPIIMLTARTDTLDKIVGLELGADDYIPKPFEPKEVLARVKAVLRRTDKRDAAPAAAEKNESSTDVISYPGFSVDKIRYVVSVDGNEIYMPPKELELLYFLASSPNRVFTREQLLDNIWGYEYVGDTRTVDVHVKRLREKLPGNREWSISTVWGIGYKFEAHTAVK